VHSQPKCAYRKKDGKPCKAYACGDEQFCFFHSPESTRERKEAQKAGGTTRGRQNTTTPMTQVPDKPLWNPTDICELLSTTINEVRSGNIQPRIATAVGYLANILLGAQQRFVIRIVGSRVMPKSASAFSLSAILIRRF
jgi:hypothetical protein